MEGKRDLTFYREFLDTNYGFVREVELLRVGGGLALFFRESLLAQEWIPSVDDDLTCGKGTSVAPNPRRRRR